MYILRTTLHTHNICSSGFEKANPSLYFLLHKSYLPTYLHMCLPVFVCQSVCLHTPCQHQMFTTPLPFNFATSNNYNNFFSVVVFAYRMQLCTINFPIFPLHNFFLTFLPILSSALFRSHLIRSFYCITPFLYSLSSSLILSVSRGSNCVC